MEFLIIGSIGVLILYYLLVKLIKGGCNLILNDSKSSSDEDSVTINITSQSRIDKISTPDGYNLYADYDAEQNALQIELKEISNAKRSKKQTFILDKIASQSGIVTQILLDETLFIKQSKSTNGISIEIDLRNAEKFFGM